MKVVLEQKQPMAPSTTEMALAKRLSSVYQRLRHSPDIRKARTRADTAWEQQKHTGRLLSSWDR